uniref:Salt-tolerance protein n=1 Tax=Rhizophora mucronata TaxID=61149 RepID=A0A2P2KRW7_RHIMU
MAVVRPIPWSSVVCSYLATLTISQRPWCNKSLKPHEFQWPETAGGSQKGCQLDVLVHHNSGIVELCLQHKRGMLAFPVFQITRKE